MKAFIHESFVGLFGAAGLEFCLLLQIHTAAHLEVCLNWYVYKCACDNENSDKKYCFVVITQPI